MTGEFNFQHDPEAARIVIDRMPMTHILPWEIAYDYTIETESHKALLHDSSKPACRMFEAINKINDEIDGKIYCCDGMAVACAIDQAIVTEQKVMKGRVSLEGKETRGGIFYNWYPIFVGNQGPDNCTLILDINFEKYVEMLAHTLKNIADDDDGDQAI